MKRYMSLVLLLLLNGCGQYSIRNIDKPPPEDYETWERPNHSILQVKKTLLECGAIAPSTVGWDYKKGYEKIGILGEDSQMNEAIKKSKCMENAGYKKKERSWSAQQLCEDSNFPERKSYPACQPNVIVSTPSVERRLNSWYCKVKTDYDYCLKYALAPKLCSSEKIKKPPSECLSDDLSHLSEIENGLNLKRNRFMVLFFPDTPPLSPESLEHMRREQDKQRLQRDTQNQNNRQMNNMLKNTAPKLRR